MDNAVVTHQTTVAQNRVHNITLTNSSLNLDGTETHFIFELEKNSTALITCSFILDKISHTIFISLISKDTNTQAELKGTCEVYNGARLMFISAQKHLHAETTSHLQINSIAGKNAQFNAASTIFIAAEGHNCQASQYHKILLIDTTATARAEPVLEVVPNSVSCAHGVAISPLDEQQLFYLLSRGLTQEQARSFFLITAHLTIR